MSFMVALDPPSEGFAWEKGASYWAAMGGSLRLGSSGRQTDSLWYFVGHWILGIQFSYCGHLFGCSLRREPFEVAGFTI